MIETIALEWLTSFFPLSATYQTRFLISTLLLNTILIFVIFVLMKALKYWTTKIKNSERVPQAVQHNHVHDDTGLFAALSKCSEPHQDYTINRDSERLTLDRFFS